MLDTRSPDVERKRQQVLSPLSMRAYMLGKLPLALFAGVRIEHLDPARCQVSLPYGWRSTNPFRSIYFAAQAMAAEMSTGALALVLVEAAPRPVSMLITGLEARFTKKAQSKATFTCEGGDAIARAIEQALTTGEPVALRVETVGRDVQGDEVSRWTFEWGFRVKTPAPHPRS